MKAINPFLERLDKRRQRKFRKHLNKALGNKHKNARAQKSDTAGLIFLSVIFVAAPMGAISETGKISLMFGLLAYVLIGLIFLQANVNLRLYQDPLTYVAHFMLMPLSARDCFMRVRSHMLANSLYFFVIYALMAAFIFFIKLETVSLMWAHLPASVVSWLACIGLVKVVERLILLFPFLRHTFTIMIWAGIAIGIAASKGFSEPVAKVLEVLGSYFAPLAPAMAIAQLPSPLWLWGVMTACCLLALYLWNQGSESFAMPELDFDPSSLSNDEYSEDWDDEIPNATSSLSASKKATEVNAPADDWTETFQAELSAKAKLTAPDDPLMRCYFKLLTPRQKSLFQLYLTGVSPAPVQTFCWALGMVTVGYVLTSISDGTDILNAGGGILTVIALLLAFAMSIEQKACMSGIGSHLRRYPWYASFPIGTHEVLGMLRKASLVQFMASAPIYYIAFLSCRHFFNIEEVWRWLPLWAIHLSLYTGCVAGAAAQAATPHSRITYVMRYLFLFLLLVVGISSIVGILMIEQPVYTIIPAVLTLTTAELLYFYSKRVACGRKADLSCKLEHS